MPVFKSKSDDHVAYLFVDFRFTPESVEMGAFTDGQKSKVEQIVESPLESPNDGLIAIMNDSFNPAISHQGSAACIIFLKAFNAFEKGAEKVYAYQLRFDEPYRNY